MADLDIVFQKEQIFQRANRNLWVLENTSDTFGLDRKHAVPCPRLWVWDLNILALDFNSSGFNINKKIAHL
jgi:hypothetical protein